MSGCHLSAEIIYFPLRKSHLYLLVCNIFCLESILPRGLTARISGFHPGGPGSTPGVGNLLFFIFHQNYTFKIFFKQDIALELLNLKLYRRQTKIKKDLFSPGIEPGTFCVLDRCDNRYTTKTDENN